MIEDEGSAYTKMANGAAPWVTIASAVVAVCSFFILLGMWLGPQKDVPQQLTEVRAMLTEMKGRLDKTDWAIEALKNQTNGLGMQLSVSAEDRNKIWDAVRDLKTSVTKLEATAISREILLEWNAELEQRNKNISAPPIPKAK
jgi:uncharacterized protein YoxC